MPKNKGEVSTVRLVDSYWAIHNFSMHTPPTLISYTDPMVCLSQVVALGTERCHLAPRPNLMPNPLTTYPNPRTSHEVLFYTHGNVLSLTDFVPNAGGDPN